MHFQLGNAVDNPDSRLGHLIGPFQVGLFIKPGFQFHKYGDFLSIFGSSNQ